MIRKIFIQNYKMFKTFDLELNDELNILVGDNEVGKSTILEAINLALTKRLNGRLIEYELTPYLFNAVAAKEFLQSVKSGKPTEPPKIVVELYLDNNEKLETLRGSNNTKKEDSIGAKLEIVFDEDYKEEYQNLIENHPDNQLIPTEYYKCQWLGFSNNPISLRRLPIRLSYIDATTIRLQSGADYFLQDIIRTHLDPKERAALHVTYRNLKQGFATEDSIEEINKRLTSKKGAITEKDLSFSIDISQKSNWEASLVPYLDQLPFQLVGMGEQNALKILLALERKADETDVVLIEEPENHLSFSSMNKLISKIEEKCKNKQIIVTTHSAYVLNKLGLGRLLLLSGTATTKLLNLPEGTQNYFKKLSGYDTLRLVLAKKAILVEGPSDELIVQKAYLRVHDQLPIVDGIDVINVRGLSFLRFLDIAKELDKDVVVVTDNDRDYDKNVVRKYADYSEVPCVTICASTDEQSPSLEDQLVSCNELSAINAVLERDFTDKPSAIEYMKKNKTECALQVFETKQDIVIPEYIQDAVR